MPPKAAEDFDFGGYIGADSSVDRVVRESTGLPPTRRVCCSLANKWIRSTKGQELSL